MGKGRRVRATRRNGARRTVTDDATEVGLAAALPRDDVVHVEKRAGDYLAMPPTPRELRYPTGHPDRHARVAAGLVGLDALLERKVLAREAVAAVEDEIVEAVRELRFYGASWGQIGEHLGITRQGARQHFDKPAC
jgi:hypothetical protein